jgi:hypothetical protein
METASHKLEHEPIDLKIVNDEYTRKLIKKGL